MRVVVTTNSHQKFCPLLSEFLCGSTCCTQSVVAVCQAPRKSVSRPRALCVAHRVLECVCGYACEPY